MTDVAARIRHAEAYPFERPERSYLLDHGAVRELKRFPAEERAPVIAAGSNASPTRLATKFADLPGQIPVTRAALHDHTVVYAAHVSRYGSLPATLRPAAGAISEIFVTWLTLGQLDCMHASEGAGIRYDYVELTGIALEVEQHGRLDRAGAYLARNGAASRDGAPVRLAPIPVRNCRLAAHPQIEMLRWLHARMAPADRYEDFMARMVESASYRERLSAQLAEDAHR